MMCLTLDLIYAPALIGFSSVIRLYESVNGGQITIVGVKYEMSYLLFSTVFTMLVTVFTMKILVSQIKVEHMIRPNNTKRILLWNARYKGTGWLGMLHGKKERVQVCGEFRCVFSIDRSNPLLFDLIAFHGDNPHSPPKNRTPNQVYIMHTFEAPYLGRRHFIKGDHFYNWSFTYSPKSDVYWQYFNIRRRAERMKGKERYVALPQKASNTGRETRVAWVVTKCKTPGRRDEYVHLLRQYIKVDIYGPCSMDCFGHGRQTYDACIKALVKTGRYKFYLSFENAACKDYFTEKVEYPMKHGLVPVVYGGFSARDYATRLPPGSYIDVRNFTSPKYLAEYLIYLDKNDIAYSAYHAWRKWYEVVRDERWCYVCRALYNSSMSAPRNVNWGKFWDIGTECDGNFLEKVKGRRNKKKSAED